jgi:hypothetical protein
VSQNLYYVISLKTDEHPAVAYIGYREAQPVWFITNDTSEAFSFGSAEAAVAFKNRLNSGQSTRADGITNDGHLWTVSNTR